MLSRSSCRWLQLKTFADNKQTLKEQGAIEGMDIEVKDLGTQFSYRGVFYIEYGGPIAIMAAFLSRPAFLFGSQGPLDFVSGLKHFNAPEGTKNWNAFVQALAITLFIVHFVKRELET